MVNIDERAAKAVSYFKEDGYNCCQSVLLAYQDITGVDKSVLATISAPLGGGMGRLREVCGAVTGMFMVSGFAVKADNPKDRERKKESYQTVQQLASSFKNINGSIICRELLSGETLKDKSAVPQERTAEYYKKRPCVELVKDAAIIIGEYINANGIK